MGKYAFIGSLADGDTRRQQRWLTVTVDRQQRRLTVTVDRQQPVVNGDGGTVSNGG